MSDQPNTYVHLPGCRWLTRIRRIEEHELADLVTPQLCRTCFPDYPKTPEIHHQKCRTCKQKRVWPCEHNGAVLVWSIQRDGRTKRPAGAPQGVLRQRRWVWPEHAHHYELVEPLSTLHIAG